VGSRDDQAGVGVDDDPVVGGVPAVLRPLGDGVVPGCGQGAAHDEYGVLGEPLAGLEGEQGPKWLMTRPAVDFETPNSGASCRNAGLVRQ
jgi:hypothetical protein